MITSEAEALVSGNYTVRCVAVCVACPRLFTLESLATYVMRGFPSSEQISGVTKQAEK
jgi:hypothetical protein